MGALEAVSFLSLHTPCPSYQVGGIWWKEKGGELMFNHSNVLPALKRKINAQYSRQFHNCDLYLKKSLSFVTEIAVLSR
jgi:hypothetical protein